MRNTIHRFVIGVVAVGLTAAASILAPVSPAFAASGGGCRNSSNNGWNIGSCVSENGGYAWPDFYVNVLGSDVDSAQCQMELIDSWGDPVSSSWWWCEEKGHYGPDRVLIRRGVKYNTKVTVWVNDKRQIFLTAWSPQLTG